MFTVIQAALSPIGYPAVHLNNKFFFNEYTAPAYLSIVCGIILICLLLFMFREHYDGVMKQKQTGGKNYTHMHNNTNIDKTNVYNCILSLPHLGRHFR